MGQQKPKRPRSAKSRTLPPDLKSLEVMTRSVHRELTDRLVHLARAPHDLKARHAVRILHDQRSEALTRLFEINPTYGSALVTALGIVWRTS